MESGAGSPPERFFNDITPLVYELQFRADAPDVAFWVEWCKAFGGPVLELGCGTGRVTLALGRVGLDVIGAEVSSVMLAKARERLAAEPPEVHRRIRLEQGDMREFDPGVQVACVIIPANTFGVLLTREDQQRTLGRVRARLRENGWLGFDLPVFPEEWLKTPQTLPPVRRRSDDGALEFTEERHFDYDAATRIIASTITYTFHRPAALGRVVERGGGRVLSRTEVEEALGSAGFAVESVWGDYDRRPFTSRSGKMIFVARRAE